MNISFQLQLVISRHILQVKATATNVDEAVRELPDANSVRYSFHSELDPYNLCRGIFRLILIIMHYYLFYGYCYVNVHAFTNGQHKLYQNYLSSI